MAYTYTPTYYSTVHDSISSLCKNIITFSFKKRLGFPTEDQKLSKRQSDNLKWQQDSFHQILNLTGLHKEGILSESEVSAFRTHLLDTLIASPIDLEQPVILRDKLLFLQELFYAKCISEDDYHSSKRPLLQRLAVQGAEIEARDIIVARPKEKSVEEWSDIDLRDEKSFSKKETRNSKNKTKHAIKHIKGAASVLGFYKHGKSKEENDAQTELGSFKESPFFKNDKESETPSILMSEGLHIESNRENGGESNEKVKKKPFAALFFREQTERQNGTESENGGAKLEKKQWRFERIKKWKRRNMEDETSSPLPLNCERSDREAFSGSCKLVSSPIGEGPDTKQIKRKLHSDGCSSDFFIDKLLGDKIKKELSRIQSELSITNPKIEFSNDQIEAISTRLPVDKTDLKKFFPKSWCDKYGDVVLDVVKNEFKDHIREMENLKNANTEKHNSSTRWTTCEHDENRHPNMFISQMENQT